MAALDSWSVGTGERVRLRLLVRTPQIALGADGGAAHVRGILEDTGFEAVDVYTRRPEGWPSSDAVTAYPEWIAWAEATWGDAATTLRRDWGELYVAATWPAPSPDRPYQLPEIVIVGDARSESERLAHRALLAGVLAGAIGAAAWLWGRRV